MFSVPRRKFAENVQEQPRHLSPFDLTNVELVPFSAATGFLKEEIEQIDQFAYISMEFAKDFDFNKHSYGLTTDEIAAIHKWQYKRILFIL